MKKPRNIIAIPESELSWSFSRSSGPGGQNVNKVNSRVQLRWNLEGSQAISDEVKGRLRSLARSRLTRNGELIFTSQRYRDQEKNRKDCLAKLERLIARAMRPEKVRKKTKPPPAAKEARLRKKRQRAMIKSLRRPPREE